MPSSAYSSSSYTTASTTSGSGGSVTTTTTLGQSDSLMQVVVNNSGNNGRSCSSRNGLVTRSAVALAMAEGCVSIPGTSWAIQDLSPKDLDAVQALCRESFPLEYPESWFIDVVNGHFIAFGVFDGPILTSVLVAEKKRMADCDVEDRSLYPDPDAVVVYILSLAVTAAYRRRGIASHLLDHLLKMVVDVPPFPKLIFLHVLSTNYGAINFYRNYGFHYHATIPDYYCINNTPQSGTTFVQYLNSMGHEMTLCEMITFVVAFLCKPVRNIFRPKFF